LFGQDTIRISVSQADSIFLATNFQLLAAELNISAQSAQVLQAKLYPNPIFTADINAYDPNAKQAFHVGNTGQKGFQLEQLILLGGKRKAEIDLAKTNVTVAEIEFQQVVQQLRFQLHNNLHTIGQQRFLLTKYNNQLYFLDTLLNAYEIQVNKGNIPLKELIRLKGAYIELNNDRAEMYQNFLASTAVLQTLLQTDKIVLPADSEFKIQQFNEVKDLQELKNLALDNYLDLQLIIQQKNSAQQNIILQKRNAIPDINLFVSYDQRGGAFNNQINSGIAIALPLWNRNQGAIKAAQLNLEQYDYLQKAKETELYSQLSSSYYLLKQTVQEYQKAVNLYNDGFEKTAEGMNRNFQKRNVSLIEFMDFFESYNNVLAELYRIKKQIILSAEQLNLLTGKEIY
jgi:cobalt-zinc-cadmium efflux system outer membrane protein